MIWALLYGLGEGYLAEVAPCRSHEIGLRNQNITHNNTNDTVLLERVPIRLKVEGEGENGESASPVLLLGRNLTPSIFKREVVFSLIDFARVQTVTES